MNINYLKYDLNIFKIYIFIFFSLFTFSFLIVQKTFVALILFGITLSTIIAYKFPKALIALTILFGQVFQFELEELLGISPEKLSFAYFKIRLSDPFIFGIIITTLLKFFNDKKKLIKFIKHYGLYFTIFLIILLIQILRNVNLYGFNSFGEFRTYYQFLLFVPYFVICFKKSDERVKVFLLLIILSLLQILVGVVKGGFIYYFRFEAYDKWLSGFGSLALLYGMFALFLINKTVTFNINKIVGSIIYLTGITIIIISSSRAVWLASAAGLFILISSGQFKLNNYFKLLLLAPILSYILLILFQYSGIDMFLFLEERLAAFIEYEKDPTSLWRHSYWLSACAKIKENLLFGHGFGQHFQIYVPEFNKTITTSPHNLYLTILFHSGILGLYFYISFIINIFIKIKKSLKISKEKFIILTSLVVLFSVHFYGIAYSFEKDFFTWMYIGLGISSIFNRKNELYDRI